MLLPHKTSLRAACCVASLFILSGCSSAPGRADGDATEHAELTVAIAVSAREDLSTSILDEPIEPVDGRTRLWGRITADAPSGPVEFIALFNYATVPVEVLGEATLDEYGQTEFSIAISDLTGGGDIHIITRIPEREPGELNVPILRARVAGSMPGPDGSCELISYEVRHEQSGFSGVAITQDRVVAFPREVAGESAWIGSSPTDGDANLVVLHSPLDGSDTRSVGCWMMTEQPGSVAWIRLPFYGSGHYQAALIPANDAAPGESHFFFGGDLSNLATSP